ncbi:MAG: tRNA preQ1(34) S-adenosylmethionine ribosyltransferase-isomerase QueA, partial [Balneolaceae bacterium]
MVYTLSDFDYDLPEKLIAQEPSRPRDHSRLLVYDRQSGSITDDFFYHLAHYLPDQSTLVVNNSKVEKCRLLFDDGSMEIFVLNTPNDRTVEALVRPGKKFKEGETIQLASGIEAEVLSIADDGIRTLLLNRPLDDSAYDPFRATPFPPYIEQNESLSDEYQTVYAQQSGSKAAPTAGLHFTDHLIEDLKKKGYGWEEITLHVGLGTFAPVKTENIDEHTMHSEWYRLGEETADRLNQAEHITAVGTTSVRVLESALNTHRRFSPASGETDIFITPGYRFKAVDSLITNFHLPKSTLLMLVAAFMGYDEMRRVYRH